MFGPYAGSSRIGSVSLTYLSHCQFYISDEAQDSIVAPEPIAAGMIR
jgi:hypothetical protein